jgi:hypothetical protein
MNSEQEYEYEFTLEEELFRQSKSASWKKPQRDYDDLDVKLGLITQEQLEILNQEQEIKPPASTMTRINEVTFYWDWHRKFDEETGIYRQLRWGQIKTQIIQYKMWGFKYVSEFKSHLAPEDRAQARYWREELTAEIALSSEKSQDFEMCYWVGKNSDNMTPPGFWAISVDDRTTKKRSILLSMNNEIVVRAGLKPKYETIITRK